MKIGRQAQTHSVYLGRQAACIILCTHLFASHARTCTQQVPAAEAREIALERRRHQDREQALRQDCERRLREVGLVSVLVSVPVPVLVSVLVPMIVSVLVSVSVPVLVLDGSGILMKHACT